MKHQNFTFYIFLLSVFVSLQLTAQDNKPAILHIPENWKFERMEFPLGFAPGIKYEGFEELIFSPGMFDTVAPDYFSYIFVMSINNEKEVSISTLKEVLLAYYKGLSQSVAESKETTIDTSVITCSVAKLKNDFRESEHYSAKITFIDSFTDNRKISLNLELDVKYNEVSQRLYILAIVSPVQQKDPVWQTLKKHKNEIIKLNPQLQ
ncbi:MAG: hypothetical protein R2750_07345 [Bacteroidales bacterium]